MFGRNFYHKIIKNHVIVFGSLFNNISIDRYDVDGTILQSQKVPVMYGPREKFLAKLDTFAKAEAAGTASGKPPVAIQLPRIAFEMTNLIYDASRRLPKTIYNCRAGPNGEKNYQYTPVPYNICLK